MLDSAIELIKNSVTTVVGLTVGLLGIGDGNLDLQTANISDTTTENTPVIEKTVETADVSDTATEAVKTSDTSATKIENEKNSGENEEETTKYFDKTDVKDAVFARPDTTTVAVNTPNSTTKTEPVLTAEDSKTVRAINPIKSTKKPKKVDTSLLLSVDFDKFDPQLKINEITEDDENYYGKYQFRSFAIRDNKWKQIIKKKSITVNKVTLGEQDLGEYLSEELGEVVDSEIIFLKEVQVIQKEKQAKLTTASQKNTTAYSGLVGKVLDTKEEKFDDYTPVVQEKEIPVKEIAEETTSAEKTTATTATTDTPNTETTTETTTESADTQAPLIVINGNNPALIQVGSSYAELGASATDNVSANVSVVVGGEVVNTEVADSYFVTYTATDGAGNVATATKEVIVYDNGTTPEVKQVKDEVVGEEQKTSDATVVKDKQVVEKTVTKTGEKATSGETTGTQGETATTTAEVKTSGSSETAVEASSDAEVVKDKQVAEKTVAKKVKETTSGETATTTAGEEAKASAVSKTAGEVATTTETTGETGVNATTEKAITPEEEVTVGDVVKEVSKGVKKGGKKAKDKVKDVVETTTEVTGGTVEQISKTVETISEEISAMIKNINLLELLGNIKESLGANVSSATGGFNTFFEGIGNKIKKISQTINQKTDAVIERIYQAIEGVADDTSALIKNIKVFKMVGNIKSSLVAGMSFQTEDGGGIASTAYQDDQSQGFFGSTLEVVSDFSKNTIETIANGGEKFSKKVIGITSTAIAKTINYNQGIFPGVVNISHKIGGKIFQFSSNMTATVADYSKTISTNISNTGEKIGQKVSAYGISFSTSFGKVKNILGDVLNFLDEHRPN